MTTTTSKTIKPGKIAVASARELQQKAQAALKASKTPKGKPEKAAVAAALRNIWNAPQPLYAVEEFGKANAALDPITMYEAIAGLCGKARDAFADAADEIAHLKHRAIPFLRKAADALDKLEYMAFARSDFPPVPDGVSEKLRDAAFGAAYVAFASEAGRWMERAEMALGETPSCGWLSDLMNVAGIPEGKDVLTDGAFRMVDPQEGWVLDYFHRMTQEQRQQVAAFITATAKEG